MTHHCEDQGVLPEPFTSTTMRGIAALAFVFFGITSGALGDSVSLTAVADTSLYQNNPDANLGATTLVAGQNERDSRARALFRFDLSAIPSGATISDVVFSLSVVRRPDPAQHPVVNSDFSLYRLLKDWGEGLGNAVTGSNALSGDATWKDRHFGSSSWDTGGGLSGTDFAGTESTSTTISGLGLYLWPSTAAMVSDVQGWVDTPSSNFGFILISQSEDTAGSARRFSSKELPIEGTPPHLNVTYFTVPESGTCGMLLGGLLGLGGITQRKMRAAVKGSALLD